MVILSKQWLVRFHSFVQDSLSFSPHTHTRRELLAAQVCRKCFQSCYTFYFFLHTGKHSVLHLKRLAIFKRCEKKYWCKVFFLSMVFIYTSRNLLVFNICSRNPSVVICIKWSNKIDKEQDWTHSKSHLWLHSMIQFSKGNSKCQHGYRLETHHLTSGKNGDLPNNGSSFFPSLMALHKAMWEVYWASPWHLKKEKEQSLPKLC